MQDVHKKNLFFALGIVLLLAFLYIISGVKKPPPLPPDAEHRGIAGNDECAPCHDKDSDRPLSPTHPPKEDCIYCHVKKAMKRGPIKYKIIKKVKEEEQQRKRGSHGFQ